MPAVHIFFFTLSINYLLVQIGRKLNQEIASLTSIRCLIYLILPHIVSQCFKGYKQYYNTLLNSYSINVNNA